MPPQAVLFVIGMSSDIVAPTVAIAAVYGVSNHSNLRINLRPIEGLFVTPRLHRRHHVPATTLANYGAIFTIWTDCSAPWSEPTPQQTSATGYQER